MVFRLLSNRRSLLAHSPSFLNGAQNTAGSFHNMATHNIVSCISLGSLQSLCPLQADENGNRFVLVHFKFLSEMTFKEKNCLWYGAPEGTAPTKPSLMWSSPLMAQPHWSYRRGSPDTETLPYQGKGSPSAEEQDGNKRDSLVQAWAPGDFGERAPAEVRQTRALPKATLQPVMAATSWALTGSVSVPEPSSTSFHLTSTTYKRETDYSHLTGGKTEALRLYYIIKVI